MINNNEITHISINMKIIKIDFNKKETGFIGKFNIHK